MVDVSHGVHHVHEISRRIKRRIINVLERCLNLILGVLGPFVVV